MKALIAFAWLFSLHLLGAQNLVPNGDFEKLSNCPNTLDQLRLTGVWINEGTYDPSPDLFHRCADEGRLGVPSNFYGQQEAKSGDGYAGLIAYQVFKGEKKQNRNHREFLMVELSGPMREGEVYQLKMSVSLAENCEYAIGHLGFLLTKDRPVLRTNYLGLDYLRPQVVSRDLLSGTSDWTTVSGNYTATGGERILTIGNFESDHALLIDRNGKGRNTFAETIDMPKKLRPLISYYYVDEVEITSTKPVKESDITSSKSRTLKIRDEYFGDIEQGDKMVLSKVHFDFNQSTILPSSYKELNALGSFLLQNPKVRIRIVGHADEDGTADYNLTLSQERASSVVKYLTVNGVDAERMESLGMGSSAPIATNDSDEGKARNRRVEFEIIGDRK